MNIFQKAYNRVTTFFNKSNRAPAQTSAASSPFGGQRGAGGKATLIQKIVRDTIMRYRADIDDWQEALRSAENVYFPDRRRLLDMYANMDDGLLSSQIGNRNRGTTSARYELIDAANKPDEAATKLLQDSIAFKNILKAIVETHYYGNTVIEYDVNNFDPLTGVLIDRRHILPENGIFRAQIYEREGIPYRELAEYGVTILEFGTKYDVGLLNKAVPHVLMKKFAMGCFSEFAERFGMPIPIVKTNTEDQTMINRIQSMLADMGSSAGMILDNSEMFELGAAIASDGALYETLVRMLNNEISMLISGAVIGQDTKNGNESKEALSIEILEGLIKEDRTNTATDINTTLLPALVAQGMIKDGLRFRFCEEEDLEALWAKTAAAMPFFDIDPDFITQKFGIPVQPKPINF